MIRMTPTSNPTNCGLCVGKVPAEGASSFFCASEPATASSGITNMKRYLTIGLSMLAGAGLGGTAVQSLFAQVKPAAYVIAEVTVNNQDAYAKEFLPARSKAIADSGGRYIVRGEELTKEGGAVDFDVMTELQFPDRAAFLAWMAQLSGPGAGEQVAADEARFLDRSRTRAYVIEEPFAAAVGAGMHWHSCRRRPRCDRPSPACRRARCPPGRIPPRRRARRDRNSGEAGEPPQRGCRGPVR